MRIPSSPAAENCFVETTTQSRLEFDADQAGLLTDAARRRVRAAAGGESSPVVLPAELAELPAFGLFVTLKLGAELRACLGNWGRESTAPLGELLTRVAGNVAAGDVRFPRIGPAECDALSIELSVMTKPQVMAERDEALIDAIEIGTHGLHIAHPQGCGLLLPNVASERGWDARTFLQQLCAKASLPPRAWHDRECRIESFRTVRVGGEPPSPEFNPCLLGRRRFRALVATARRALRGERPPVDDDPELDAPRDDELGVRLGTRDGGSALAMARGVSLRRLVRAAADELRAGRRGGGGVAELSEFLIAWHGIELAAADHPRRHAGVADRAVLVVHGDRPHLDASVNGEALNGALAAAGADLDTWRRGEVRVLACATLALRREATPAPRPAAVAGRFYPGDPDAMRQAVREYLRFPAEREACRAVMLPHAGWAYCGDVVGRTLARVEIPRRVVVIGPRHRPMGAQWSIAPHDAWRIPGAEIPVDVALVALLDEAIPELRREPDAHAAEHGTEVLLPFLHELQPELRIVPITIGQASYADTQRLAAGLARALDDLDEPPLVVISSDMNHFAEESRNRELDELALSALRSGEPKALFDVCTENDISMCGMRGAVATMNWLSASGPIAPEVIAYDTSATAGGDTSRVVGYAGAVIR